MEIQKADPRARRKALVLLIIATIIGAIVILLLESQLSMLEQWISDDPGVAFERLELTLAVLAVVVAVPLLGLAAYIWRLGARVIKTERFPPPGMAVIRDTPALTGTAARLRGRLIQAFAVIFALMAFALPIALWQIVDVLERA